MRLVAGKVAGKVASLFLENIASKSIYFNFQLIMQKTEKTELATRVAGLPQDAIERLSRFTDRLNIAIDKRSLREIEHITGISQGAVRNYKDGKSLPDLDRLLALAFGLGVNLLWLATGEGSMRGTEVNDTKGLYYTGKVDLRQLEEAVRIVEGEASDKPVDWKARMMVALYDLGADVPNDKKVAVVRAAL